MFIYYCNTGLLSEVIQVFKAFIEDAFDNISGMQWVNYGRYQLLGSNKGSLITARNWGRSISPGVRIYMSMIIDLGKSYSDMTKLCANDRCRGVLSEQSNTDWTKW